MEFHLVVASRYDFLVFCFRCYVVQHAGGVDNANGTSNWREQQLYGSSRLGMWRPNVNLAVANGSSVWNSYGLKFFELSNHLGNVMAVISDNRVQNGSVYEPVVVNANDYYAFGGQMAGRGYDLNNAAYRYGFNGKENDNEVKGEGNQQDYGMRIYDPRIGKFLSVDPLQKQYPELTPYQFASNTPIQASDLDGLEADFSKAKVNLLEYHSGNGVESNVNTFGLNTVLSIYNGVVDMVEMATNYNPVTNVIYKGKGYGKLYDTAKGAAVGAYDWATKTTWKQKGEDLKGAATNPHSYEVAAAVLLTHKLGKITGPLVADDVTLAVKGFESGGTKLVSSEMLAKYPNSPTIGLPSETFIAPTSEVNELLKSGLSRSAIAEKLGIVDKKFLVGDLIRVDVSPKALNKLNLRPTTGAEAGANNLFIPGGKTSGGVTEGVVNGIPKKSDGIKITTVNEK